MDEDIAKKGPHSAGRDSHGVDGIVTLEGNTSAGSSLPISTSKNCNDNSRPILVGYAFGPKKMSTMGHIMAEASRAVSTVITAVSTMPDYEERLMDDVETSVCFPAKNVGLNATMSSTSSSGSPNVNYSIYQSHDQLSSTASMCNSEIESVTIDDLHEKNIISIAKNTTLLLLPNSPTAKNAITNPAHSHNHQPIMVSFVPLDVDYPLEEQHGGKFDVILHKLTEDILCLSKISSSLLPHSMCSPYSAFINCRNQSEQTNRCEPSSTNLSPSSISLDDTQRQAISRVERLDQYKKAHPSCCLIDHPANVMTLMSRADISEILSSCLQGVTSFSGIPVRTPSFVVINHIKEIYDDKETTEKLSLPFSFPFLSKPLTAAGTSESHKMGIVLGKAGLQRVNTPCLLQSYANHDGVLYKVYVLGDIVKVFPRKSLPNLPQRQCMDNLDDRYCFVEFDSQRPYPQLVDLLPTDGSLASSDNLAVLDVSDTNNDCPGKKRKRKDLDSRSNYHDEIRKLKHQPPHHKQSVLSADEIRPVVSIIRKAFGLELFGFDVLVSTSVCGFVSSDSEGEMDHDCGRKNSSNAPSFTFEGEQQARSASTSGQQKIMYVVDVNYFPSYKEITKFPSLLAQYLTQRAIEGRLEKHTHAQFCSSASSE